jgi:hypothetical protein
MVQWSDVLLTLTGVLLFMTVCMMATPIVGHATITAICNQDRQNRKGTDKVIVNAMQAFGKEVWSQTWRGLQQRSVLTTNPNDLPEKATAAWPLRSGVQQRPRPLLSRAMHPFLMETNKKWMQTFGKALYQGIWL